LNGGGKFDLNLNKERIVAEICIIDLNMINDKVLRRQIHKQGKIADDWLDRYILRRYMPIANAMEKHAKLTVGALKDTGSRMTYARLRKMYNLQALGITAAAQVSQLASEAAGHLRRDAEDFHKMGVETAVEQALAQIQLETKDQRDQFRDRARRPVRPDPVLLQNVLGAMPIKAHRLGPIVGEQLQHNLADVMVLSRGFVTESRTDKIIEDCMGTGLAFLLGMFSLALWSLFTNGIFSFMDVHADWISGWIWYAILDMKTCPSCIWLHGQRFPRDVIFRDHPHGRCEPIIIVEDYPWWWTPEMGEWILAGDIIEQTGEDWFERLSEEEKEEILGRPAYAAHRAGAISLADLSTVNNHDVYGQIRLTASLRSILGNDAEKYYVSKR